MSLCKFEITQIKLKATYKPKYLTLQQLLPSCGNGPSFPLWVLQCGTQDHGATKVWLVHPSWWGWGLATWHMELQHHSLTFGLAAHPVMKETNFKWLHPFMWGHNAWSGESDPALWDRSCHCREVWGRISLQPLLPQATHPFLGQDPSAPSLG